MSMSPPSAPAPAASDPPAPGSADDPQFREPFVWIALRTLAVGALLAPGLASLLGLAILTAGAGGVSPAEIASFGRMLFMTTVFATPPSIIVATVMLLWRRLVGPIRIGYLAIVAPIPLYLMALVEFVMIIGKAEEGAAIMVLFAGSAYLTMMGLYAIKRVFLLRGLEQRRAFDAPRSGSAG